MISEIKMDGADVRGFMWEKWEVWVAAWLRGSKGEHPAETGRRGHQENKGTTDRLEDSAENTADGRKIPSAQDMCVSGIIVSTEMQGERLEDRAR